MYNTTKLLTLILAFVSIVTFSQTEEKKEKEKGKFTLSGSVDVYGTSNLSDNSLGTIGVLSDVPAHGFGLGMANTVLSYEKGKVGAVADLTFGPRGNAANAYAGAINQLYVYYQASEKFKFTLGQFNTFFGYEVISPVANFNYSVSRLFNAGPFSHTGLKVDFSASEDLSFMLAVTNPHAITAGSNTTHSFQLGFQAGYKGQFFNVAYGADGVAGFDDVLYLDYTGGFDVSDSFYVGINAAFSNSSEADAGYYGAALYLQNKFSEKFSLGLRPEYYANTIGSNAAPELAFTLSGNVALADDLKLIPELRLDTSNDVTYFGKDNITSITLAAVYSF